VNPPEHRPGAASPAGGAAAGPSGRQRWRQHDLLATLVALGLLLAWDFTGLDLPAARLFGGSQGFGLRDTWWASTLLHDGGRNLAWLVMAGLIVAAWRASAASSPAGLPTGAERWRWIGVILLCVVLVPALKRVSATSCPWELSEFGGVARYVSHWAWQVTDGGPGHCFPSGHAVSAFAFLGMYFLWRDRSPQRARAWLVGVLVLGSLFGAAQLARGAHYPSHTFWSAWLCWVIAATASHTMARRRTGA
jgi:membrane-associated PAP2 superfamily phosphatase